MNWFKLHIVFSIFLTLLSSVFTQFSAVNWMVSLVIGCFATMSLSVVVKGALCNFILELENWTSRWAIQAQNTHRFSLMFTHKIVTFTYMMKLMFGRFQTRSVHPSHYNMIWRPDIFPNWRELGFNLPLNLCSLSTALALANISPVSACL